MNLKNDKFNYSKKYKSLCKYLAIALPLLLLLIACIFPTKQINNKYTITTSEETQETYNFNQLFSSKNPNIIKLNLTASNLNGNTINMISDLRANAYLYELPLTINHKYLFITNFDYSTYGGASLRLTRPNSTYYSYNLNNIITADTDKVNIHYVNYNDNLNSGYSFNVNYFDLTLMGLENITQNDFLTLFPLYYYDYFVDKEYTITTITNNIGNQAEQPLQSDETKQPNENILQPLNLLYKANINSWYDSFLTAFELNYEDNNYMYYLVHYPLYILYVLLLDLLLDIILLVPCLLHRVVHKYKGDD